MINLELPAEILALCMGIASLSSAGYVLARTGTPLLRQYISFNTGIFLITLSFFLRSLNSGILWLGTSSIHEPEIRNLTGLLEILSSSAQGAGAVVLITVLPFFSSSLFGLQPGLGYRRAGIIAAVFEAAGLILYFYQPSAILVQLFLAVNLFGNIAVCLAFTARQFLKFKKTEGQVRGSPLKPGFSKMLPRFLLISVLFFPLFIGDIIISNIEEQQWMLFIDNTSVPLYFIFLNIGCLFFLKQNLDHPALMEGDKVSGFGRTQFGLTAREADVLEYVLDGYTLKDLAGVLKITPKTAENHLYSIYQKTGVTNRIQLFQAFANQKQNS